MYINMYEIRVKNREEFELIQLKDNIYALTSELQLRTKECRDKSVLSTLKDTDYTLFQLLKYY